MSASTTPRQPADYLHRAAAHAKLSVMAQRRDGALLYAANLPEPWAGIKTRAKTDRQVFGNTIADELAALRRSTEETGALATADVDVDDRTYCFDMEAVASSGGDTEFVAYITELTEDRRREIVLKTLLREVSHRSRNLLAIIQSIATQTARNSDSLGGFLERFRGRLYSLAHSQDLVTDSSWRGAYLFDLARRQFEVYAVDQPDILSISGENIHLNPTEALHVGLALHELAVNSATFGVIGSGAGEIELGCRQVEPGADPHYEIVWDEVNATDGRDGHEPVEGHFGSAVLERIVPSSIGGKGSYDVQDNAIHYRLEFPRDRNRNNY